METKKVSKLGVDTDIVEAEFPTGHFGLFTEDEFGDLVPMDNAELVSDDERFLAHKRNLEN